MEIKKVEEIYLDEFEDTLWSDFYALIDDIYRTTTDEDIQGYAYDILDRMDNLVNYMVDK